MMRLKLMLGLFFLLSLSIHAYGKEEKEPGLVGLWLFDEGSGDIVRDSSGNGNVGKIHGARWVEGRNGKALEFDGDDYLEIPNSESLSISKEITVIAWVKWKGVDATKGYWGVLVGKMDEDAESGYWLNASDMFGDVGGYFGINGLGEGKGFRSEHGVAISDKKWFFVAGVYDGASLKVYVDGVEKVEKTRETSIKQNELPVAIGASFNNRADYFFHGIIDGVRIYNSALSAKEIEDLRTNQK